MVLGQKKKKRKKRDNDGIKVVFYLYNMVFAIQWENWISVFYWLIVYFRSNAYNRQIFRFWILF